MFFTPVIRRAAYTPNSLRGLDRGFERFFQDTMAPALPARGVKPYSLEQDEHSYTLSIDVPGLTKEQLNIAIESTVVRIESVADAPRSVKAAYEFPQELDIAGSSAKLDLGVLTLKLVKKLPVSQASTLNIQ